MPFRTRKFVRIAFAGVLFLLLLTAGLAWLRFGDCAGSFQRTYHRIVLGDKDFISRTVRFRVRGSGAWMPPSGRLSGFTTLRASDCVEVASVHEDEGSPSRAVDEIEKRARGAVRIIERSSIRDEQGEPVGERLVLLQQGPKAEIISLEKGASRLYVIESRSLAHALAYEKLIKNGARVDRDGYVIGEGK